VTDARSPPGRSPDLVGRRRFVLNNSGHTVERYLHGIDARYNDIPMWDYGKMFKACNPCNADIRTFKGEKAAGLDALMSDEEFNLATYPQVDNLTF
jgi:pyruvate decarboxylase